MTNSLGEYNIAQSSSANINNIKWSQKRSRDTNPSEKKKVRKIASTNIIYTDKIKIKNISKIIKIEKNDKSSKKKNVKKFQNSSASVCKIKQGFKRPGR